VIHKSKVTLLFFLVTFQSWAQTELVNLGGTSFVTVSDQVPEELASDRSLVVISVPNIIKEGYEVRGDWKKLAMKVHKFFRKMSIDPIAYIYQGDLNAGPEVNRAYLDLFEKRKVKNIVYLRQEGTFPNESYYLMATGYYPESYIKNGQAAWISEHTELEQLLVRMGRQILRQQIDRTNMLIPEYPDYLQDIAVFAGTRFENFPSRLKTLKLAVVAFQHVSEENVNGSTESAAAIAAYNELIDEKNARLADLMLSYPFKYDIVTETSEDALYKAGYQYALVPLTSTGKSIKSILNYPTNKSETHYMTNTFTFDGKIALDKIPVDAIVTKYYIKQTIVKDIHTGKVWDANPGWEKALENFMFYLNEAF